MREVGEGATGDEDALEGALEESSFTSNGLIVGLLIVAIGLLLYPRIFSSGRPTAEGQPTAVDTAQVEERSIAVLPFQPLSTGEESETFSRGVHDDLLTRLANISDPKVISRTAVQQFRDTDLTTGEIADSLGVRWVMEGGVQVLQDQIQVNAQLIDPQSETHAWVDDYRRDLTTEDLFALQTEITREISRSLRVRLTDEEEKRIRARPTQDLRAYRLHVRGQELVASRNPDSLGQAIGLFQRVLRKDSAFARGWAGLADARILHASYSAGSRDSIRAAILQAEKAVKRALKLDPNLAEAHATRAIIHMYKVPLVAEPGRGPAALRHLKRAVELKPSYTNGPRSGVGISTASSGNWRKPKAGIWPLGGTRSPTNGSVSSTRRWASPKKQELPTSGLSKPGKTPIPTSSPESRRCGGGSTRSASRRPPNEAVRRAPPNEPQTQISIPSAHETLTSGP